MIVSTMIRADPSVQPHDRLLARMADYARRRLKRIEQIGFDEVLLVFHSSVLEDIEPVRDFL